MSRTNTHRAFIASLAALATAMAVSLPFAVAHSTPTTTQAAADSALHSEQSHCMVTHTKRAEPRTVTLGATVDITLTASVTCPPRTQYQHVVIVQEESSAMDGPGGSAAVELTRAAVDLVRHLDLPGRPSVYVGVVAFSDLAYTKSWLISDERRVVGSLRSMGGVGGAEIDRGLAAAERVLQRGRQHRPPEDISEIVVLFSRARDDNGCEQAVSAAQSIKGNGTLLMSVCAGDDCDVQCSRRIASSSRYAFSVADMDPVKAAFDRRLNRGDRMARLVVTDTLGADVAYVSGSALPAAARTSAEPVRWLAWEANGLATSSVTISLKVRPLETGRIQTNEVAIGLYEDDSGGYDRWTFESPSVYVRAPVPTATRSPTAAATPSPITPTPSSSPTPSAVPTPIEQELLLPYALKPQR